MSLSGVVMNAAFTLVLAAVLASDVLVTRNLVLQSLLAYLLVIQVALIVLNLLPLPGLDGYGVIEPFLPRSVAAALNAVRPWGLFILLALVLSGGLDFVWDAGFTVGELLGADPGLAGLGAYLASLR